MTSTVSFTRFTEVADPRLGRHVRHDERSRRFPYRARRSADIRTVQHTRLAPIFDQGDIGSCVPNAGVGVLGYQQYADCSTFEPLLFTEQTCVGFYRKVTAADEFPGSWEPDDTGSDGLSMAKVFRSEGLISGYLHIFTPDDFMAALMDGPLMVGTVWREGMFEPGAGGVVSPTGALAGGHEYLANGYDADTGLIRFDNSWGAGWGEAGRFRMHRDDFFGLLAAEGDATVLVPETVSAPEPADPVAPVVDQALVDLASSTSAWRSRSVPAVGAKTAQRNLNRFLKRKGYY